MLLQIKVGNNKQHQEEDCGNGKWSVVFAVRVVVKSRTFSTRDWGDYGKTLLRVDV